jgi:hypothetical protein
MEELKQLCDKLYLSMNRDELIYRHRFLDDDGIKIFGLTGNGAIEKGFYINWAHGGEKTKPTRLLEFLKTEVDFTNRFFASRVQLPFPDPEFDPELDEEFYQEIDPEYDQNILLTGDEWEKKYERAYYEKIYKALIRPTIIEGHGGSKQKLRKTRKKRNTRKN